MKNVKSVSMFGVIIYISPDRHRAIIWCEDHGPLAYVRADKTLRDEAQALAVGDCVRFSARTDGDFRVGRGLEPVSLPPVAALPDMLKAQANDGRSDQALVTCGNIVYPEFTRERRYG